MDSRARMMLDALNTSSAQQPMQTAAQEQPMRYADGGSVGLPSLAALSSPDFDWSSLGRFAPAPSSFTPMTQDVPMFVARSPAYGSMGTDVYDWKAPTAQAAPQPYSTVNQEVALTQNRRVPEEVATVGVPMPGYATPMPNVPGAGDAATITPSPVPVSTPATSITNPLGPDPFEVRRSEAAAELEAYNQRQAAEAARMAEAQRVAAEAAARREQEAAAQRAAQVAEEQRVARIAEEKRLADKLLSDTQQIEARRLQAEQARLQQAEQDRLATEASARQKEAERVELERFLASAPREGLQYGTYYNPPGDGDSGGTGGPNYSGLMTAEQIRQSGKMPTVQSGGYGRWFEEVPGYGSGDDSSAGYMRPYEEPGNSWYAGDGG